MSLPMVVNLYIDSLPTVVNLYIDSLPTVVNLYIDSSLWTSCSVCGIACDIYGSYWRVLVGQFLYIVLTEILPF